MKRVLLALALLGLVSVGASAQLQTDLSGGVFIAHHPAGLLYSSDPPAEGWCAFNDLTGCADQNNDQMMAGADDPIVWYVIAAFLEDSEWCGIEFGLEYTPYSWLPLGFGMCVPGEGLEIPGTGWPAPGTGTSVVTTTESWQGNFMPVYWFGGYGYYGGLTQLIDNPGSAAAVGFANCDQVEFPAACFGGIGWGDGVEGVDCCPEIIPDLWACCLYDGTCMMLLEDDCLAQDGVWYEGLTCDEVDCPVPDVCCVEHVCYFVHLDECDALGGEWHPEFENCGPPNPCEELTPADDASWGSIKAIYR